MQLVIDQSDFQRLPPDIQRALIEALGAREMASRGARRTSPNVRWREPVDLRPDQAARLAHGLSDNHRRRLELFARKGGRVRMKDMQAIWGDPDLRAASDFQKAMTRRLRRIINDPEKKAQLIGWDFDATKWDAKGTTIVDGVYYVSTTTAEALREVLKQKGKDQSKA